MLLFLCLLMACLQGRAQYHDRRPAPATVLPDSITAYRLLKQGTDLSVAADRRALVSLDSVIGLTRGRKEPGLVSAYLEALRFKGNYYNLTGRYDSARYFGNEGLQQATALHNNGAMAKALVGLAIAADHQADYETAVRHNLSALRYFEAAGDSVGLANTYGNLGNTYIRLSQNDKAIPLLQRAIALFNALHIRRAVANNLNNLARAYKATGNDTKELELKLQAFTIFREEGYKKGMATVAGNLGNYYEKHNQLAEARHYYRLALENSWAVRETGNIAIHYNNMADLFIKTREFDQALLCTDSAAWYAGKSGNRLTASEAWQTRAAVYHAMGKDSLAYLALGRYQLLNDSLFSERMRNRVSELEVQYETQRKENAIVLLQKNNAIQQLDIQNKQLKIREARFRVQQQELLLENNTLELLSQQEQIGRQQQDSLYRAREIGRLHRQSRIQQLELQNRRLEVNRKNLLLALLLATLVAVASTGYLLYRRYKARKDRQLQAAVALQQQLATQALFEGEQQERIRLARDLHDSIGQLLSLVKMQLSALPAGVPGIPLAPLQPAMQLVDKTIQEVRTISHNLIPEELNLGLCIALEALCGQVAAAGPVAVSFTAAESVCTLPLPQQTTLPLYRVVQEVLGNMARHSGATQISVALQHDAAGLVLHLHDNGRGLDPEDILQSGGLGWKNIHARVRLLNGSLHLQSGRPPGTRITIHLPL